MATQQGFPATVGFFALFSPKRKSEKRESKGNAGTTEQAKPARRGKQEALRTLLAEIALKRQFDKGSRRGKQGIKKIPFGAFFAYSEEFFRILSA